MMNGIFFARRLQQHHPVPRTPTNEERIRAYRARAPVALGNGWQWKWYARDATPGPDYDKQLREGFALKYGSQE